MGEAAKPSVLLVDDEPKVLSALQRGLRRESIELSVASNAEEALLTLETSSFALVISDQKMPGMSGVDLLTQVRARWPSVARILLTGWSSEIDADALEAAGLFAILPKPWDDGELREAIRNAVKDST